MNTKDITREKVSFLEKFAMDKIRLKKFGTRNY